MKIHQLAKESYKYGKLFEFSDEYISNILHLIDPIDRESPIDLTNMFLPFNNVNMYTNNMLHNIKNLFPQQIGIADARYVALHFNVASFLRTLEGLNKKDKLTNGIKRPTIESMIEQLGETLVKWKLNFNTNLAKMPMVVHGIAPGEDKDGYNINQLDTINGQEIFSICELPQLKFCILHPTKRLYQTLVTDPAYPLTYLISMANPAYYVFQTLHESKRKRFVIRIRRKITVGKKTKIDPNKDKFIYLTPTEFHNLTETDSNITSGIDGDTSERASHFRRAHYRTLQHERYGKNIGKKIYIKPIWVGTNTKKISNKQYKVMLDSE